MARKIIKQNSSFGVLRANPRISGNVKITVDSSNKIWLNSIDSNPKMSSSIFKGFSISPEGSYDRDLYRFFENGTTPTESVFGLIGEDNPVQNLTNNLSDVYNFYYNSGISPLISNKYSEDFSYLAPLWIGDDIPDYFVIFKVDDPIDYSYLVPVTSLEIDRTYKVLQDPSVDVNDPSYIPFKIQSGSNTYSDGEVFKASVFNFTVLQGSGTVILLDPLYNIDSVEDTGNHFYDKILPKSTIVSTFDLRENSNIGKYLRKIKSNPGYTDSLIDVRFEDRQLTTFNGVNYSRGIFDKKGDYLLDYYQTPDTQISFEETITDGFKNNGIVSYKLLNLEFLFNDNDSKNYTINRYFGLYVNAPEMASFRLDGDAFFKSQGNSGNTPIPDRNNKGYYYEEVPYFQYNDNGVRLYLDPNYTSGVLPDSDTVNVTEENKVFWIKDRIGNFHSLKRSVDYGSSSPTPYYSSYGLTGYENQLVIQDSSIDLSLLTGRDSSTRKQYYGVSTGEKGRAYIVIKIGGELEGGNDFVFYNPLGKYGVAGSKYDIIKASDLSTLVDEWGPGSYYGQDGAYYFHPYGTNEDIVKALAGVFNSFSYNSFEAFQSGDELVIRTKASGTNENSKYYLDFFRDFASSSRISDSYRGKVLINEKDACDINQRQSFIGGSNYSKTRVKVKREDANKIEVGSTFIETIKNTSTDSYSNLPGYSNTGISKVVGKYRFVDQYAKDQGGEIIGLKDFETHATLEIEGLTESIAFGSTQTITAFDLYDVPVGIFSFYGVRELDMDFWESEYGHTPTEEYYKYLDVQPGGVTKIIPGKTYYVSPGVNIIYPLDSSPSNNISGPSFFTGVAGEEEYTIVSSTGTNEANVYPTLSTRGTITSSIDASTNFDSSFYPDLDSFPGFYGIQAIKYIDSDTGNNTKYDQLNFGKLYSEYDYTNDNYNPDYALKSRVSPYISKWVYRGGTDVRGNEYRFNSSLAFNPLNFSPSFFRRNQDPQYFTHEWYQLQRPPYSLPEENLHKDKSYLASEINESLLSDANPSNRDYFTDYFSVEGEDFSVYYPNSTTIDNIDLSERYSLLDFNPGNGFSETLFRGVKIRIKRSFINYGKGENIEYIEDDRFYDGYKFSCVIIPVQNILDEIQSPISIKVIENRTFKNITFLVKVVIEDARTLNFENISPENQYIDLDYFLLYSLKDKISSSYYPVSSAPSWLIGGEIELPGVGDIKLSAALNISSNATPGGLTSLVTTTSSLGIGVIYSIPNPNYETDLRDEINFTYLPTTSSFPGGSTGKGSFYGVAGNPPYIYTLPFPTGVGENFINFTAIDANYFFDFSSIGITPPITIPTIANYGAISNIPIYQREGGGGYWNSLFEKISFSNISTWVNTGYPYIEYLTYIWDESTKTTKVLENQFTLEFIRPSAFSQDSLISSDEITDKPQEISAFNIGYEPVTIEGESELYRYSGEYVPKFREILKFENVKYDIPFWTVPDSYTFNVKVVEKDPSGYYYDLGSSDCFSIDGKSQNIITLVKGVTYYFDVSDSSNTGNQIYFSYSNRGKNISVDSISQGYTLFGTPGTSGAYVRFDVPYDIKDTVYYVSAGEKYMGSSIKILDSIEYLYCSFGPYKDDFGVAKNVNYYKYSNQWIFKIGKDSPYNPAYNLIGETPIDRRNLSIFESSWDPGFYREYTSPTDYTSLPGTKNMKEQKAFFGSKFMKTPGIINTQKQNVNTSSIDNVLNVNLENYPEYDILWEETSTEIRGILLIDRMLYRYFLNDGAKKIFQQFIVPEFGFGTVTDIDDDFKEYIYQNVVGTFESKTIGSYIKKIAITQDETLTPVVGNLADYEKLINGYFESSEVSYTKVNDLRYEFTIPKDPSFDYSIGFSIQIGKI